MKKNGWHLELLVVLGYLLLAVVVTWPLVPNLAWLVVGDASDTDLIGHIWHCWWFGDSLAAGKNPYVVDVVFHPFGSHTFLAKSGPCLNALSSVPFQPVTTVVGAYNLSLLGWITFNGWAAYRLARYTTGNLVAALPAGLFMIFNPFFLTEMHAGRMDQFSFGWCLLYALFFLRTWREDGLCNPVLAGIFLGIGALSFLGNPILLFFFTLAAGAFLLVTQRERFTPALVKRLAVLGATAGLVLIPLAVPFMLQTAATDEPAREQVSFELFSLPDSMEDFTAAEQIIVRNGIRPGSRNWPLEVLPVTLAVLTLAGALIGSRQRWLWVGVAGLFVLLALGPYYNGPAAPGQFVPLPALFFYKVIPFLNHFRVPYRFLGFAWVSMIMLASLGLAAVLRPAPSPRWRAATAALLAVLGVAVVVEAAARPGIAFPAALTAPDIPAVYTQEPLAAAQPGAVLGIPIATHKPTPGEESRLPEPKWSAWEMLFQTAHGRPILNGHWVALGPPPELRALLQENRFLRGILALQRDPGATPEPFAPADIAALQGAGYRFVVLTMEWLPAPTAQALESWLTRLFGPPLARGDRRTRIFHLNSRGPALLNRAPEYEIPFPTVVR